MTRSLVSGAAVAVADAVVVVVAAAGVALPGPPVLCAVAGAVVAAAAVAVGDDAPESLRDWREGLRGSAASLSWPWSGSGWDCRRDLFDGNKGCFKK